MSNIVWMSIGLIWLASTSSLVEIWRSRQTILAGTNGRAQFQVRIALNIMVIIAAAFLTAYALGASSGKARALAENRADAAMGIN